MDRMYLCFVCSCYQQNEKQEDYSYNLEGQLFKDMIRLLILSKYSSKKGQKELFIILLMKITTYFFFK
jgi:hypothetical protein